MSALTTTALEAYPGSILYMWMDVDRKEFGTGLVQIFYDTKEDYVPDLEEDLLNYQPRSILVLVMDKMYGKVLKSTKYAPPYFQ